MAEPRTYHQFKKIVRATAEKGSADIILANVKDDKQMKDLISLYEMQKATKTFDRVEYADLLREVADPLGQTWNMSGKDGSQGPLQPKEKKEVGRDEIADLINQVQSEPKKKKISAEKLLGEKPKKKSAAISADKLVPPKEGKDDADEVSPKTDETKRGKTKGITSKGVDQLAVNLNVIAKELTAINVILGKQLKNQEKYAKKLANEARKDEREKKEKESESVVKKVATKVVDTIKKPFVSFFDKLMNFLKNIALGTAIIGILDWLRDPENQQRIENFANFIIDSMPLILGGIAAFIGIGIGAKVLGIIGGVIGALKGLVIALGPLGLKGALIAIAATLAAFAVDKFVKEGIPAIKDFFLGTHRKGFTKEGMQFERKDVQNIYDTWKVQNKSEVGTPEYNETAKQYMSLLGSFDAKKGMEDELKSEKANLVRYENNLSQLELSPAGPARDKKIKQQQEKISSTQENIARLENNITFALKRIADQVSEMQLESHIKRQVQNRGGDVSPVNVPGVTTNLPGIGGVTQSSGLTPLFAGGSGTEALGLDSNFMSDSSMQAPTFDITSATGEMTDLGVDTSNMSETPKVPLNLAIQQLKSDPVMFSGKKGMIYDIPSPKMQSETIVLPIGGGGQPENQAAGMASPVQNLPPSFSPFDLNNPTLAPVLSVYNALS